MAKDTRNKRPTRKKKGLSAKHIMWIAVAVFLVLLIVFVVIAVKNYSNTAQEKDDHASNVNKLNTTPEALQDKVAYYVVGLLGEDMEKGVMEHLSLVCYDKEKKTLNVMEIPQDTYLGETTQWQVKKTGQVWGNPAPLTFCQTEGKQIFEVNIETCRNNGHQIQELEGSSKYNVGAIFNTMALPVDGHYYLSQDAFVDLVDSLGGIDVELEKAQTLGGIEYRDGVRTLDGAGALEYALNRSKGVEGDIQRLVRQRKVLFAVFQRLTAQTEDELTTQSIGNVMGGGSRVFFSTDREDTIKLIRELAAIKPEKITAQVLPGVATTYEGEAYYSVLRAELIKVLNADFHPYDNKVTEADLQIAAIATEGESESHKQTMAEIAVKQTGLNEPAVDDTTTSTTDSSAATTTKR